jgi:hypothetical protein
MNGNSMRVFALGFAVTSLGLCSQFAFAQGQGPAGRGGMQGAQNPSEAPTRWKPPSILRLKASNAAKEDQFGYTIALSGDGNTMAVGAIGESSGAKGINGNQADNSALNSGAVYVFVRSATGWKQQAYVKASNPGKAYQFGTSISLSDDGNTLAVGSNGESSSAKGINGDQSDASMYGAGAVYVFTRSADSWSQQAYVKASNTGTEDVGDQFGFSVALSGDGNTLAVGATSEPSAAEGINGDQSDKSAPDAGAVYVFTRAGKDWSQQAFVKPWNTTGQGNLFGYSVGLSGNGDTMAVGAYNEDGGKGTAYIFTRKNGTWAQQSRLEASNAERGDSLGCALAISADGNTLAVGAFDEDSVLKGIQPPDEGAHDARSDVSTGAAYVFVRNGNAWSQQAFVKATNTRLNDQFGWALTLSGDGNTLAVGAHLEDSGASGLDGNEEDASAVDSGAVYVYTRKGITWTPVAYVKASTPKPAAEFGLSLALNGDGKVLAVGAPKEIGAGNAKQADKSATNVGAAYVYY